MREFKDIEGRTIVIGQEVAVYDTWYKRIFRGKVTGFTKHKVRVEGEIFVGSYHSTTRTTKFPGDILIIEK